MNFNEIGNYQYYIEQYLLKNILKRYDKNFRIIRKTKPKYKNIPGWFDFENLYDSMVESAQDGSIFVEIGAWFGKSTSYLLDKIIKSGKDIKLFVVDTWEGSRNEQYHLDEAKKHGGCIYDEFFKNMCEQEFLGYFVPLKMTSLEASALFKDGSIDFAFIDANHSYSAVKMDLQSWFPKIKIGGDIAGHDIEFKDVKRAVCEFFFASYEDVLCQKSKTCWYFKKTSTKIKRSKLLINQSKKRD